MAHHGLTSLPPLTPVFYRKIGQWAEKNRRARFTRLVHGDSRRAGEMRAALNELAVILNLKTAVF